MQLTKNFTLPELTRTQTGICNTPNNQQKISLLKLCANILQPARELYGKPIHVNSGYRSYAVNKAVGGARKSQHTLGEAADITVFSKEGNKMLFELIRDNLHFDQLIDERNFSWIHVSYRSEKENRKQVLKL